MADLEPLKRTIIDGSGDASRATRVLLDAGVSVHEVLHLALLPAVDEVGGRVKDGTCVIPEVVRSAQAMRACLGTLWPGMADGRPLGVVVVGTPKGEIHDLGKSFTSLLLGGAGFEVHDVGTDVPARAFLAGVVEYDATIVAMSAMLPTTIPGMKRVIEELAAAGVRDRVKVLVGGGAVRPDTADKVGADAGCSGPAGAVECAWRLAGVES
jgi:methanogenic corrinoid protein MtbC1